MNRRSLLKTAAAAGVLACLPGEVPAFAADEASEEKGSSVTTEIVRLNLRHTWTTVMSASNWRETLFVHYKHDGITGIGEGAPIVRYKESAQSARTAVNSVLPLLDVLRPGSNFIKSCQRSVRMFPVSGQGRQPSISP